MHIQVVAMHLAGHGTGDEGVCLSLMLRPTPPSCPSAFLAKLFLILSQYGRLLKILPKFLRLKIMLPTSSSHATQLAEKREGLLAGRAPPGAMLRGRARSGRPLQSWGGGAYGNYGPSFEGGVDDLYFGYGDGYGQGGFEPYIGGGSVVAPSAAPGVTMVPMMLPSGQVRSFGSDTASYPFSSYLR